MLLSSFFFFFKDLYCIWSHIQLSAISDVGQQLKVDSLCLLKDII